MEKMSFSAEVKNELTRIKPSKKCCQLAEIAGFIRVCGVIRLGGAGKISLNITTENPAIARHMKQAVEEYFHVKAELLIGHTNMLKKHHLYGLTVGSEMNGEQILRETGILLVKEGCNYISDGIFPDLIKTKCCKKSFLKGAFLGAGSVTDPEKSYHLEILCNSEQLAQELKKLINTFGLHAKETQRKKNYLVYLKEGEQIMDTLNILGAHGKLLAFENTRILKEMRNKTNRISNCDNANMDRAIVASSKQVESINKIEKQKGLNFLPPKLYQVAIVRKENPEVTLTELGELMDPPMGKSGVNHRLKKIQEIAEKL